MEYCNHDQLEYDPSDRLVAKCLKCGQVLLWDDDSGSFNDAPIDYTGERTQ